MTLSINDIVRVTAVISPTGAARREFGRTLFLTTDKQLSPQERTRLYTGTDGSKEDFSEGSEPYEAGLTYFEQNPYPKPLIVGRYVNSVESGFLDGGKLTTSIAEFQAITDGSATFILGTVASYNDEPLDSYNVTAVDFSADATFADMASTLETEINTQNPSLSGFNIQVTYEALTGDFQLTYDEDTAGTIAAISYFTTGPSGTDISGLIGFTEALADELYYSTQPETVKDALDACEDSDGTFYFITTDKTVNDTTDSDDVADWVETAETEYQYSADSVDIAALSESDSTFKRMYDDQVERSFGTWSKTADYKGVSAAGRLSSINFTGSNTLITMFLKDLPRTDVDKTLSANDVEKLKNQRINRYVERSGSPGYEDGFNFKDGVWTDARYFLDWFVNAVRVENYNLLKQTPTHVPQTDGGMAQIVEATNDVCIQSVNNGGLAGGVLSAALTADVKDKTGNQDFDGVLANGYLVYADPITSLSQTQRNNRESSQTYVWLKSSSAIHNIEIAIVFEN